MGNEFNSRHLEHNDGQDRCIARKGSVPKKSNDGVAVHPGMTPRQKAGAGVGGDGGQSAALAHVYGTAPNLKIGKSVPVSFGMKSRGPTDLGRAILKEAGSGEK